jgi:DNA-binding transcriptional ArsR family regulator
MRNQARSEAVLDALGDATRRRIVEQLRRGPVAVGELAARLPVGRPAVSKHLRVLEGAGLVEHRSVGTRNLYALAPQGFVALQQWLVRTWDTALVGFAEQVAAQVAAGKGKGHTSEAATADPAPGRRTVKRGDRI